MNVAEIKLIVWASNIYETKCLKNIFVYVATSLYLNLLQFNVNLVNSRL